MENPEFFLWTLFQQLRRRSFPLGIKDYEALRQSLRAGFGWSSTQDLCDLCCALWAKSSREQEVVRGLFAQLQVPVWDLSSAATEEGHRPVAIDPIDGQATEDDKKSVQVGDETKISPITSQESYSGLPALTVSPAILVEQPLIFAPQFPLTHREIAQAWRRLRNPVRQGPAIELDIEATIRERGRVGIATPPVLVPRRSNNVRLLLLCDRHGSMAPFHALVDYVYTAMREASRLDHLACYYFHDVPAAGADRKPLQSVSSDFFPRLDSILPEIKPLSDDFLYEDADRLSPIALGEVLQNHAKGAGVVILSDGGAARRHHDAARLLDTLAFMKALRCHTSRYVWLNPVPRPYWAGTTAEQIARHIPMLPLDKSGLYQAVNVLRGQPYPLDKPL